MNQRNLRNPRRRGRRTPASGISFASIGFSYWLSSSLQQRSQLSVRPLSSAKTPPGHKCAIILLRLGFLQIVIGQKSAVIVRLQPVVEVNLVEVRGDDFLA